MKIYFYAAWLEVNYGEETQPWVARFVRICAVFIWIFDHKIAEHLF